LSRLLNVSSDGDDVTVAGKLFHTRAWWPEVHGVGPGEEKSVYGGHTVVIIMVAVSDNFLAFLSKI